MRRRSRAQESCLKMTLRRILAQSLKQVAFRHTSLGVPKYPFNIEPLQLATLVFEIDRPRDTIGAIVEVGVARGMTTRFISEHLPSERDARIRGLYAIDTFPIFSQK
jgi:hypothetical protein